MKRFITFLSIALPLAIHAQPDPSTIQNGLLFKITGKGLTKPSYLYGTMHVSSKLAFHLGDSFFNALSSVQSVGLETDPSQWFDQMMGSAYVSQRDLTDAIENPDKSWDEGVFFYGSEYQRPLSAAMNATPYIVNGFLYRNREGRSDYEEDTYLDLFIYQAARKLGKPVHSLEDFEESERLTTMARAARNNGRHKSYRSRGKLSGNHTYESVYRSGNLAMLDSLDRLAGYPEEWYEGMLYQRNRNMVKYADSVLKFQSIFMAVGASHLPGQKGMIALLKSLGYTVTVVGQGNKLYDRKATIDKMNVPVKPMIQYAPDSLFSVVVPSKLISLPKLGISQKYLSQDLSNGSYYLITRVHTYAAARGFQMEYVLKQVDSLVYENIPGKIESRISLQKDGHPAIAIVNKTNRGNVQRHLIVILPNEVVFFRMHGLQDYVKRFGESFFQSIRLKPLNDQPFVTNAHEVGFTVQFPVQPTSNRDRTPFEAAVNYNENWVATDSTGKTWMLMKATSAYPFLIDDDSFNLELLSEGLEKMFKSQATNKLFSASKCELTLDFISEQKDTFWGWMRLFPGQVFALIARGVHRNEAVAFFNSFTKTPIVYPTAQFYQDSLMHAGCSTYFMPFKAIIQGKESKYNSFEDKSHNLFIVDRITGEQVVMKSTRYGDFSWFESVTDLMEDAIDDEVDERNVIWKLRSDTVQMAQGKCEGVVTDTGSCFGTKIKWLFGGNALYTLKAVCDSSGTLSPFAQRIFESFVVDSISNTQLFKDKTCLVLSSLQSEDSLTQAHAKDALEGADLQLDNAQSVMECIDQWKIKDEETDKEVRNFLVEELGYSDDPNVIPFLSKLYLKSEDDPELQVTVLYALSHVSSKEGVKAFREIIYSGIPEVSDYRMRYVFDHFSDKKSDAILKEMIPIMLTSLHEESLKDGIYEKLSKLADKQKLPMALYKDQLPIMRRDAKRLVYAMRDNESRGGYSYRADENLREMARILKLLVPYHGQDEPVTDLLNKMLYSGIQGLQVKVLVELIKQGKPFNDSILTALAENRQSRKTLYAELVAIEQLALFPKESASGSKLAEAILFERVDDHYNEVDTIACVSQMHVKHVYKDYQVYLFKYRIKDDIVWQMGVVGIQVVDSCSTTFEYFAGIHPDLYSNGTDSAKAISMQLRAIRKQKREQYNSRSYILE